MADGTIIIDTKIDNSGAKIGVKEMGKSLKRIEKSFDGISKSSLSANNNIEKSFSKQNEAIKKQEILLESLKGKYAAITSGASAEKKQSGIEKQLQSVQKEITKTEQEYNALIQKLKSLEAVQNAGSPASQAQTKADTGVFAVIAPSIFPIITFSTKCTTELVFRNITTYKKTIKMKTYKGIIFFFILFLL